MSEAQPGEGSRVEPRRQTGDVPGSASVGSARFGREHGKS